MLPEGEESTAMKEKEKEEDRIKMEENSDSQEKFGKPDSTHPTLIMVNKWSEEDVRRKFRNYEI